MHANPRRAHVLSGGYLLSEATGIPVVALVGMGAVMPQVLRAARILNGFGLLCDVICLTSADLVFRAQQVRCGLQEGDDSILEVLFPPERRAPMVSVLDGHPHTLSFLGRISGVPLTCLGVAEFGQVGDVMDLYRHFGIDAETIAGAAMDLLD